MTTNGVLDAFISSIIELTTQGGIPGVA